MPPTKHRSQRSFLNNTLYLISAFFLVTTLVNKGWLPYVCGIATDATQGTCLLIGLSLWLMVLLSLLVIFFILLLQPLRLGLKPFWALRGRAAPGQARYSACLPICLPPHAANYTGLQ